MKKFQDDIVECTLIQKTLTGSYLLEHIPIVCKLSTNFKAIDVHTKANKKEFPFYNIATENSGIYYLRHKSHEIKLIVSNIHVILR